MNLAKKVSRLLCILYITDCNVIFDKVILFNYGHKYTN